MKSNVVIFVLIFLSLSVSGQKKIKKLEINETGFEVIIKYDTTVNRLTCGGLELIITPVSGNDLNDKFNTESSLSGQFKYSYIEKSAESYFLKYKKIKREKTDFEFYVEGLNWLIEREQLTDDEYNRLYLEIFYQYTDTPKPSTDYLENKTQGNPYFIDGKYLSIFRIEIINNSSEFKYFDNEIVVESGMTSLIPVTKDFLIRELERDGSINSLKSFILERYNLEENTIIPPQSKIVKYFATLPIDYRDESCKVALEGCQENLEFKIEKSERSLDRNYVYYAFNIQWLYGATPSTKGETFVILSHVQDRNYYLDLNKELYVAESELNNVLTVITLSQFQNMLYFRRIKVSPSTWIDFEKNKRTEIPIGLMGIDVKKVEE